MNHNFDVMKNVAILLMISFFLISCSTSDDDIQDIVGSTSLRINNVEEAQISIIKTDPDVAQFIKNITSNE